MKWRIFRPRPWRLESRANNAKPAFAGYPARPSVADKSAQIPEGTLFAKPARDFSRQAALAAALVLLLVLVAVARLAGGGPAAPLTQAARAHALGEQLACPICEGLSVADSPSALAGQMRAVIAEQIAEGQSDAQIEQYFVTRYGPGILRTPPKQGFTLLAWWTPVLVILASAAGLAIAAYRWSRRPPAEGPLPELTPEEERRYAERLAAEVGEESASDDGAAGPVAISEASVAHQALSPDLSPNPGREELASSDRFPPITGGSPRPATDPRHASLSPRIGAFAPGGHPVSDVDKDRREGRSPVRPRAIDTSSSPPGLGGEDKRAAPQ